MIKKQTKGILFTVDAIFAIVICLTIILSSFFFLSQTQKIRYSDTALDTLNTDMIVVLTLDGTLERGIQEKSSTGIKVALDTLPVQACMRIIVKFKNESVLLDETKTGCTGNEYSKKKQGTFALNGEIYLTQAISWYEE